MKIAKRDARSSVRTIPELRFEDQELTSFGGGVLFQALFAKLGLRERLRRCVRGIPSSSSYGLQRILLVLITHLLLGWRRLRDLDYYRDDPMALRLTGLARLPSVSAVSRSLRMMTTRVVSRLRAVNSQLVLDRVQDSGLRTLTVDFDGSVLSTKSRKTEGTAVGFNPKGKGQRSYYPLLATLAQTGQVLDLLHRPGNVHDSRGAKEFAAEVFQRIDESGFRGRREARLDSAHFSDEMCFWLHQMDVQFSISTPFERFSHLKAIIEKRRKWHRVDDTWSFFEYPWVPKNWTRTYRCVVFRKRRPVPRKGELQLELFAPVAFEHEYKAVITNRSGTARALLAFHNGRGSQESFIGELKSHGNFDYIATRRSIGNQVYALSAVLAHNLSRELQMTVEPPRQRNTLSRACLWVFERAGTLRRRLIQRAGRLNRPRGIDTLTLSANPHVERDLCAYMAKLLAA